MARGQAGPYLILLSVLLAATLAGYLVFYGYASGAKDIAGAYSLYVVAAFAGIATFFSPCTLGLLPAYLSYYLSVRGRKTARKGVSAAVGYGSIAASGIVAFNVLLGILLALLGLGLAGAFSIAGGGTLAGVTLVIRGLAGLALVFLGVAHWAGRDLAGGLLHRAAELGGRLGVRERGTALGLFLYGFAYNLTNIGCTGPLLAGLILLALASGVEATLAAFLVYSATMAALMIAAPILIGAAEERFVILTRSTRTLQRFGAVVLVLAGLFLLLTVLLPQTFTQLLFPH